MKTKNIHPKLIISVLLPLLTIFCIQIMSYANNDPVFTDGDSTQRSVRENTTTGENIGDPVSATDADADTLTYSLGGDNASSFAIDSLTGQLKTSAELNYESKNTYKVTITVSDGNEGSDTIKVTIKVRDVVDVYTPLSERTPQVTAAIVAKLSSARTADDVGDEDLKRITQLSMNEKGISELKSNDFHGLTKLQHIWLGSNSLTTLPSGLFKGLKQLTFLALFHNSISNLPADIFEGLPRLKHINIYRNQLTSLPDGLFKGLPVLTKLELRDNPAWLLYPISFKKVDDGVYRAVVSKGATFDMEFPVTITNGYMLGGGSTIKVSAGNIESSENIVIIRTPGTTGQITLNYGTPLPSLPSRHKGYWMTKSSDLPLTAEEYSGEPVFTDGETTTRTVNENAANSNVGSAVSATGYNTDSTLTYTLSGTDADIFSIVSRTGQIKTVDALNYETKNSYAVTVTATDDDTALDDSIDVTINVTNVNEPPVFAEESLTLSVDENTQATIDTGVKVGDPITATDPDANTTLRYSLGGTHANKFTISRSTGQIRTDASLDYEKKRSYSVKVIVSDNGTPKKTDSIDVTININDVLDGSKPLNRRTSEVKDAIVDALTDVSSADDVNDTHLASITSLNMSNKSVNSLQEFDFNGLSALETLKLDGNSLTSLPEDVFYGLSALTNLDLSSNSLTSLRDDIFEDLTTLTNLDLSSNSLSSLPHPGSLLFLDLENLEALDLSSNSLTTIYPSTFFKTKKLTSLDLSSNSIESLPGNLLEGLTKLEDLDVSNNLLSHLPDDLFKGLSSLTTVNFEGNTTDPLIITVQVTVVDGDVVLEAKPGAPSSTSAVLDIIRGTGHYIDGEFQSFGNRVLVDLEIGKTRSKVINIMRTPGEADPVLVGIYRDPLIDENYKGIKYVKSKWYKKLYDVEEGVATAQAPNSGQQIPDVTAFLPNYPNPFNPETWIPFHLAKPADVTMTIYSMRGVVVRELVLGYQPAGYYQTRARAAHWDGRNNIGEKVSTGVYFVTFNAGDFTATRKMIIRK